MATHIVWSTGLRRALAAGLALAAIGWPALARAQTRSRAPVSVEERLRLLEEEVRELRRERDAARKAAATAAPAPAPVAAEEVVDKPAVEAIVDDKLKKQKVLAGWKDGFFLESPNGDFKLKLRGYTQADARFFPDQGGDTGNDSFFMRRVRPIFEGTVYKYFDFRIMPDFGLGNTVLQDAYADIRYFPYASLRVGKFKEPFSLERLQSGADLVFIERSIAQNLSPNRDVGIQLWGDLFDGAATYQVGVFDGTVDGGNSDDESGSDKDVAGRVFVHPFKPTTIDPLKGLGVGIATTIGRQENESLSSLNFRTTGRSTFFRYNPDASVVSKGTHWRLSPQLYHYWGPFGMMFEYFISEEGVAGRPDPEGPRVRADQNANGWFLQASYVLTGEDASYKTVVPINPFDPRNGRWGAFEIAGRVSQISLDDEVFEAGLGRGTDAADEYVVGLNWYFNKNFKIQFNYGRTEFDGKPNFSGQGPKNHEDVLLTRFQIAY